MATNGARRSGWRSVTNGSRVVRSGRKCCWRVVPVRCVCDLVFNRLVAGQPYHLEHRVKGSVVTLPPEGVEVVAVNLPVALPQSQVGVWCHSSRVT
jgi:hypothetical protein